MNKIMSVQGTQIPVVNGYNSVGFGSAKSSTGSYACVIGSQGVSGHSGKAGITGISILEIICNVEKNWNGRFNLTWNSLTTKELINIKEVNSGFTWNYEGIVNENEINKFIKNIITEQRDGKLDNLLSK